MNKLDIIKTYIFEPNYNKYEYTIGSCDLLKIFYRFTFYNYSDYLKIKIIKKNYIICSYFNHHENWNTNDKIKNYDNTKIDINHIINSNFYNYDLKINDNSITKKIDDNTHIVYDNTKYIFKNNIIKTQRHHVLFNLKNYCIKYHYYKEYITYYINYYTIIYNINKNNIMYKEYNYNKILYNFSRNFMIII